MMIENWENHWKDYYKILQIDSSAEDEVVKAAYSRLARKYHPDVNRDLKACARMKDLNEAFEILGNLEKRNRYHSEYVSKQGKITSDRQRPESPKPAPEVSPSIIRFDDVLPGVTQKGSFIIRNTGGAYERVLLRNPPPWIRIVRQTQVTAVDKLPLRIEIEAEGESWGKSYSDSITVKLDDAEAHVGIELHTRPEPAQRTNHPNPESPGYIPEETLTSQLVWIFVGFGIAVIVIVLNAVSR